MKKILITQKIFIDKYNQLNFALENFWLNFFDRKKHLIIPFFNNNPISFFNKHKPNLVIFSGGANNVFSNKKEDKLRRKIEKKILYIALKK